MKKVIAILTIAFAFAVGGVALEATPIIPTAPKAEASTLSHCYTTVHHERWCYRANCTYFERVALGCYDGWIYMGRRV